ncbi:MAG: glutamate--tRNA ligase family protein, partial [Bacteroidota bacterium]
LHKGNVFSILLTWLIARANQGQILLRIDDLDRDRVRSEYIEDIFRTLDWLGIDFDEGPENLASFESEFSQKKRVDLYRQALDQLRNSGVKVFNCACSRSDISRLSGDGSYPGTCVDKKLDTTGNAIRIYTKEHQPIVFQDEVLGKVSLNLSQKMKHFVIWKKDDSSAYQLSSLVDDLYFNVNTVVRGSDLIESTAAQLFLATGLKEHRFTEVNFSHHPLIQQHSRKLSKSQGADAVEKTEPNRMTLLREFSDWLKIKPQVTTLPELREAFEMSHVKELGWTIHHRHN